MFKIPEWVPTLGHGGHTSPQEAGEFQGACFMELASWLADEPWSDSPRCANKAMSRVSVCVNDALDDDERQKMLPLVPRVINTAQWDDNPTVYDAMVAYADEWHEKIHNPDDADDYCEFPDMMHALRVKPGINWDALSDTFEWIVGETQEVQLVDLLAGAYDTFDKAARRDIDPVSVEQYRLFHDFINNW